MEIVYKGIGEIRPYENNPRKNDGAVDAVACTSTQATHSCARTLGEARSGLNAPPFCTVETRKRVRLQ